MIARFVRRQGTEIKCSSLGKYYRITVLHKASSGRCEKNTRAKMRIAYDLVFPLYTAIRIRPEEHIAQVWFASVFCKRYRYLPWVVSLTITTAITIGILLNFDEQEKNTCIPASIMEGK